MYKVAQDAVEEGTKINNNNSYAKGSKTVTFDPRRVLIKASPLAFETEFAMAKT